MRKVIYAVLVSLPAKAVSGGATVAGLYGTFAPESAKKLLGDSMIADNIQFAGMVLLAFSALYFCVLWLLKPDDEGAGLSTSGHHSPVIRQEHSGSGDNIGYVGRLQLGYQRFEMTQDDMSRALAEIDRNREVVLMWASTPRSQELALRLDNFLRRNRVTVAIQGESYFVVRVSRPLGVYPNGIPQDDLHINPHEQCIFVDAAL